MSLRDLPPRAYDTVHWTTLIPHVYICYYYWRNCHTTIHGYINTSCTYPLPTHALHVECNLPDPNTHIRTSTTQPPRLLPTSIFKPEYRSILPIPAFLILMFLLTSLTLQMYRVNRKHSAGCRRSQERELIREAWWDQRFVIDCVRYAWIPGNDIPS